MTELKDKCNTKEILVCSDTQNVEDHQKGPLGFNVVRKVPKNLYSSLLLMFAPTDQAASNLAKIHFSSIKNIEPVILDVTFEWNLY